MDEGIWIFEDEPIETSFETSGYTFYIGGRGVLGTPQESYLRLIAVRGSERMLVDDIAELGGLVQVNEPTEALEFVRLFTSLETHYLFPSITYIEPRQSQGALGMGEYSAEYAQTIGMTPPRTFVQGGVFVVERNLLTSSQELVRATELVEPDGTYTLEEMRTLDERSQIPYPVYE